MMGDYLTATGTVHDDDRDPHNWSDIAQGRSETAKARRHLQSLSREKREELEREWGK